MAIFDSVDTSVARYILNLNTLKAYQRLPIIHGQQRDQSNTWTGLELVEGLTYLLGKKKVT